MNGPTATSRTGSLVQWLPTQLLEFFRSKRSLWAWAVVFFAVILVVALSIQWPRHNISLPEAANTGNLKEVKWLLDHGADVNGTTLNDTALFLAVGRGYSEIAHLLVSHGADVNAGGKQGRPALIAAIGNHHPDLAKWLIALGSDVNLKDQNGDSILHYAAHYGNAEVIDELIAHGAAINALGEGGRTPLYTSLAYRATALRDISIAEALLKHGADPDIGVTNDAAFGLTVKTPMELAVFLNFPELEQLLRKYGGK